MKYETIRNQCKVFKSGYAERKDLFILVTTENEEMLRSLARFVALAMEARKRVVSDSE